MGDSKMTGYEMFEKYKAYYGVGDYAHKFITAALNGANEAGTSVSMDFSGKDDDFKVQSAKTGSAFWSNWMYLIWEMEDAIETVKGIALLINKYATMLQFTLGMRPGPSTPDLWKESLEMLQEFSHTDWLKICALNWTLALLGSQK